MLQKYPAISLWKRVKKFFEGHVFFSNITINHKLILFILRKDCPKCNLKRRTATKRSNRSAAFDYNILLCFIKFSRFRPSIPSFRTLRRKNIKTQHKHPSYYTIPNCILPASEIFSCDHGGSQTSEISTEVMPFKNPRTS